MADKESKPSKELTEALSHILNMKSPKREKIKSEADLMKEELIRTYKLAEEAIDHSIKSRSQRKTEDERKHHTFMLDGALATITKNLKKYLDE